MDILAIQMKKATWILLYKELKDKEKLYGNEY